MGTLIRFDDVSIKFGDLTIFENFSFEFQSDTTYYLTGPNGSGKTVLLKLALGLLNPDSGAVTIDDSLRVGKSQYPLDVGAIVDRPGFIADLCGFDNLAYLASFRKVVSKPEITAILERVGLDPKSKKLVKSYSLGMKQRLAIAQAIMEQPQALLLDEAFNALDKAGKTMLHEVIHEYQKRGALIILTTHTTEDLEGLEAEAYRLQATQLTAEPRS